MVTNNTYLTGITHRQMRASLGRTFDHLYVLDLHGSSKRREQAPDGSRDQNVFPIQQGVAIGLFVKSSSARSGPCRVMHADLWGSRTEKLEALATADVHTVSWTEWTPRGPFHFFVPRDEVDAEQYRSWPRLDEIFNSTSRECRPSAIGCWWDARHGKWPTKSVCCWPTRRLASGTSAPQPGCGRKPAAPLSTARNIRPYAVAPFDLRWVYYEPRLLGRARHQLVRHWIPGSPALVFMRQATDQVCTIISWSRTVWFRIVSSTALMARRLSLPCTCEPRTRCAPISATNFSTAWPHGCGFLFAQPMAGGPAR